MFQLFTPVFLGSGLLLGMFTFAVLRKRGFRRMEVRLRLLERGLRRLRLDLLERCITFAHARAHSRLVAGTIVFAVLLGTTSFAISTYLVISPRIVRFDQAVEIMGALEVQADEELARATSEEIARARETTVHVTPGGAEPRFRLAPAHHDDRSIEIRGRLSEFDQHLRDLIARHEDPVALSLVLIANGHRYKRASSFGSAAILLMMVLLVSFVSSGIAIAGVAGVKQRRRSFGGTLLAILHTLALTGAAVAVNTILAGTFLGGQTNLPCMIIGWLVILSWVGGMSNEAGGTLRVLGVVVVTLWVLLAFVAAFTWAHDVVTQGPLWRAGIQIGLGACVPLILLSVAIFGLMTASILVRLLGGFVEVFHGWAIVAGSTRLAAWILFTSAVLSALVTAVFA